MCSCQRLLMPRQAAAASYVQVWYAQVSWWACRSPVVAHVRSFETTEVAHETNQDSLCQLSHGDNAKHLPDET